MKTPFGFLVIDKPAGITSHDCVSRLRKVYAIKRVGHGGTLDPAVTGILPIALGNATRLLPYLPSDKSYYGTIQLGITTNTDDLEGEVICKKSWPDINTLELEKYLSEFRGDIKQCPPKFSSVNLQGERAYKKARRGESFILPTKEVTIHKLNLIKWDPAIGQLEIKLHCSSGTYIRSIARDLGSKIRCGGALAKLRRTQALGFKESQSIPLPQVSQTGEIPSLINPLEALNHLPKLKLVTDQENLYWRTGRQFLVEESRLGKDIKSKSFNINRNSINLVIIDKTGELAGIAVANNSLMIQPKVVFNARG